MGKMPDELREIIENGPPDGIRYELEMNKLVEVPRGNFDDFTLQERGIRLVGSSRVARRNFTKVNLMMHG